MTSFGPLVKVCRQVSFAVEPAATVIFLSDGVVGFGPPLQAMGLLMTSLMGPS